MEFLFLQMVMKFSLLEGEEGGCDRHMSSPAFRTLAVISLSAVKPSVTYLGRNREKSCGFVQGRIGGCWEWQC